LNHSPLMPAKAGIQFLALVPAFAGTSGWELIRLQVIVL
jgi:hypothetical protein